MISSSGEEMSSPESFPGGWSCSTAGVAEFEARAAWLFERLRAALLALCRRSGRP